MLAEYSGGRTHDGELVVFSILVVRDRNRTFRSGHCHVQPVLLGNGAELSNRTLNRHILIELEEGGAPVLHDREFFPGIQHTLVDRLAPVQSSFGGRLLDVNVIALLVRGNDIAASLHKLQSGTRDCPANGTATVKQFAPAKLGVGGHTVNGREGILNLSLRGLDHCLVICALVGCCNSPLPHVDEQPGHFTQRTLGGLHH